MKLDCGDAVHMACLTKYMSEGGTGCPTCKAKEEEAKDAELADMILGEGVGQQAFAQQQQQ